MRFINKQRHKMTCGATAVANCLKALGQKISYDNILSTFDRVTPDHRTGVTDLELTEMLNAFGIKFKRHDSIKSSDISKILDQGNLIVFRYSWKEGTTQGGHVLLIRGETKKFYKVCNGRKNGSPLYSKKRMFKHIYFSNRHDYSTIGFEILS